MLYHFYALLFLFGLKPVFSHLKDLGEVTYNWSAIIDEMQSRILGGKPANLTQDPSIVQFFNFGGICAGTILTSKTVLTAAHCFDFNKNAAEMKVFSNARFIFDPNSTSHDVWEFVVNEYYDRALFSNDIAIIMIHDDFSFGANVKKALLVQNLDWMNEKEMSFEATGWGATQEGGTTSQRGLLKTDLRFISQRNCSLMSHAILSPDMFCLYGDGARDTCQGDSGGGIMWNDFLVGIVSHGHGCAQTPSMYVNVYYFIPWIKQTVLKLYGKYCSFHQK